MATFHDGQGSMPSSRSIQPSWSSQPMGPWESARREFAWLLRRQAVAGT